MANKIVALLLLVCLVVGNVQAGPKEETECTNNCQRELSPTHSSTYVTLTCVLRCANIAGILGIIFLIYFVLSHSHLIMLNFIEN